MLDQQFAKPNGWIGKAVGWFMTQENDELNKWTVSFLDIQEGDAVLEIGFGAGESLCQVARRSRGRVFGIDPSEAMVETAVRRLQKRSPACDICLIQGEAALIHQFETTFDKIYAVNNITYWEKPVETLVHLRSLLSEGGRIALTLCPHEKGAEDQTTEVLGGQLRALLNQAGFSSIEVFIKPTKPNNTVCAVAMNQ
ncbi:methyltransferase domain-containing protein [Halobacillus litoralis]|uniref:class I SAM-dependent methyltransferase n=1 Tax=Halobacillus litoralis TaxID=45668 RepID=UPI001CD466E0|nr:methyltransferase domain-containing protein [Halobacillus litoralis]MCA0972613.1 methyltransferase domain-containing protein [Halobacillus litoralis]